MNYEETDRIKELIVGAIEDRRSKEEVTETFIKAGIINKSGNLKYPYKEIYIPPGESKSL